MSSTSMPLGITVTFGTRICVLQVLGEIVADADHGVGALEHRACHGRHRRGQLVDVGIAVHRDDERPVHERPHDQRAHAQRQREVQVNEIRLAPQPAQRTQRADDIEAGDDALLPERHVASARRVVFPTSGAGFRKR